MLQQSEPEDFVIATGKQHTVREFVDCAAAELEIKLKWSGSGVDEKAFDGEGNCIVAVDPRYFRPTEVATLLGDARKARDRLGWSPRVSFRELVTEMVRSDLKIAEREEIARRHGYKTFEPRE